MDFSNKKTWIYGGIALLAIAMIAYFIIQYRKNKGATAPITIKTADGSKVEVDLNAIDAPEGEKK